MIDTEPVRPSIVVSAERRRLLQGDIDAIILKALRKEPASRYASIEQLSLDIGRYLEGMPVLARSGTFTYRAGKLLRRSRGVIFLVTTILVILSSATVISLGQADKAQKRFNNVRQLANAMVFDVDGKLQEQGGATEARERMVRWALQSQDSLAKEVGDDAELSKDIAAAYMKVGDIQGSILISNLGRPIDGLKSYEKAQELLNGLVAAGQQGPDLRWALAQVHIGKGSLYRSLHEPAVAQEESLLGLELVKTLPQDGTFNYRLVLGARTNLWAIAAEDHDFEEMARQQGEIRDLAGFWAKADSSKVSNYWQAVAHQMRGRRSLMLGDPAEGAQALRESASILTALMAEKPEDPDFRREVWMVHLLAGLSQCGGGDTRIWIPNEGNAVAAEEEFNKASRLIEQDVERDPSNARARAEWMVTLDAHAWLIAEHIPEKAAEQFQRARKIFANLPAKTREQGYVRDYERAGQCAMAESLARLGRRDEALAAMKSGLALAKENATGSTVSGDSRIAVWTCTYQAGRAWMALGDEVQAERLF
ncbi:MAG TPA: hypothetical protein PK156_51425, partial [Polyangium sp.]|nr:hypothetical protein [Polyangium sp.]